ncbi:MBL fold metallo-hydrolase [Aestuariicella hydrocarbonica]|uniref:MBL fold metallo-hydrolase n=1 Tax=Pseudomaricurvus hydrocarbonicus TaxID=1470433 RepID=A0A9E5T428_9GAMM|nr:MBL fold metallo-hydrolase [Aestuariicella hydrocarbonica]NHO67622.1 MBL fold metallo-hydrolase [Aestuariicella hydrocarbonica]
MSVMQTYQHKDLTGLRVGRFNLGINTSFIVYRLQDTVIDTGPTNQWQYVKPFIEAEPFEQLLLTHHHEDHSGNAGAIHRLTDVQPMAPTLTIEILKRGYKIPPMQKVIWGNCGLADAQPLPDDIRIGGEATSALFTPGHAKDMTCYLMRDRGWLFSADLYIASRLKLLRSDEDVGTLLDSIRFTLGHDFDTIVCPHRGVVENGQSKLREKYDNLMLLSTEAQSLRDQGLPLTEISRRLLGKEGAIGILTRYNFSKRNLIASCLQVDLSSHRQ